eukprot:TRINITY_DN3291_c0_g1_i1.p1 TRINITY_DN3291_c0_g1~~TRINITY_DN3291_c0_g1_i1.p1  ORF type:complete len:120 (-),score=40.69 TRINITY_DN3291_c0_g1_i1:70-390(-)
MAEEAATPCDAFVPQAFKKTHCQTCFLPQAQHAGQAEVAVAKNIVKSGSTSDKRNIFEEKMKEQTAGEVTKKTTWTAGPGGSFSKKTKVVGPGGTPPPKKSFADLP